MQFPLIPQDATQVVLWGGLALGCALGAIAQVSRFCTMGALADWFAYRGTRRLMTWVLAVLVAAVGALVLVAFGLLDATQTLAWSPRLLWLSYLVGGTLFGFGMVLASGCPQRNLVRLGSGSLKALVVLLVAGLTAQMTLRGVLSEVRVNWLEPASLMLARPQDAGSRLAHGVGGSAAILRWAVLAAIGLHSLVEYPLWYAPFQIAAACCLWLLWSTRRGAPAEAGPAPGRRLLAVLLLAGVGCAGWDYHRISQIYLPREQRAAAYRDDAMAHARRSWLFADAVRFAEVTTRPPTRDNAAWLLPAALQTLHYSPEPRDITQVIESASLLGRDELALTHLARFRAAFPREYRQWSADNRQLLEGAQAQLRATGSAPKTPANAMNK